jgi:hypothetical protein
MIRPSRPLVAAILVLAACTPSGTGSPDASASGSTAGSSAPTGSGEPAASEEPTATPTPPSDLPAYICGLEITGPASIGIAHTANVRVGTHAGYDRIVFEYIEGGTPAYRIGPARAPYTKDPSGLPLTVAGSNVLEIVLNGATKVADDGSPTYGGATNFEPGYLQLAQLVERGDFEAVNTWYLGLEGGDCLRAFVLSNPSRIVIDIQH